MRYQSIYAKGENLGFSVTKVVQHVTDRGKKTAELTIKTPFTYQGENVEGYAVVDLAQTKEDELRPYNSVEFYVNGRNLEDVADQLTGKREFVMNGGGISVTRENASVMLGSYAAAASEYPHVFTYPEYMEIRSFENKRLQMDPPTEKDYELYLNNVQNQMSSGRIKFVGDITNVRGLLTRYQDLPSFENGMQEYDSSFSMND